MTQPYTVLHGGFHKTASTFLQKTLQRNKGKLARHGVHYVPHRDMRLQYTVPCQRNVAYNSGLKRKTLINDHDLRQLTSTFFAPILEGAPERLILSDENLAGHCGHCIRRGTLYRHRDPFVEAFAKELPVDVREIHLSVRNYADFFAAAYVEYLRSLKREGIKFVPFEKMCTRVFFNLPGWNGVINTLEKYFPEAHFYIWRFEDFITRPDLKLTILQNLVGEAVDPATFSDPKGDSRRASASGRAVAEMALLAQTEGLVAVAQKRKEIQDRYPRGDAYPAFDPWKPWEREHLVRLYDDDIARLGTNRRVTILS